MNQENIQFYRTIKDALNQVGPGMCLAKWYQTTLHLENGHNHSCHHPRTHQTPLDELEYYPDALHNTTHKQRIRGQMINGQRPDECRYCWNIEDTVTKDEVFADRVLKSSFEITRQSDILEKTLELGWDGRPIPSHVEVSFSTTCNFACSYCSADVSSSWMKELKEHGPYLTEYPLITLQQIERDGKLPIPDKEYNPYIEAFWKWWPDLYPALTVFRITGGEPLLSSHTFKVLDYIIANPNPNIQLAINSNMCVPDKLIDRFISKIKHIVSNNLVKHFTLYTSCEAQGDRAEYIRHGLEYDRWYTNCQKFLSEVPYSHVNLMSTYNLMSVTSYVPFLQDMTKLKKQFPGRLGVDTSYMANPKCMTLDILPKEFMINLQQQLRYVESMYKLGWYDNWELHKIQRLQDYFQSRLDNPINGLDMFRRDFKVFVDEHDRRRNTNFLKTFPEMQEFYNLCAQS
jgi:hypothetical protein